MTNVNKINGKQKDIMAQFMFDHPNLAKNLLPNCGQGKETAKRLWDELASRLNSSGPPTKEVSAWRKESKKKTGGGPYEEIPLSHADEQIVQAAGIEASVDGISTVKTFGRRKEQNNSLSCQVEKSLQNILDENTNENSEPGSVESPKPKKQKTSSTSESKLDLLMTNIQKCEEFHTNLSFKLDRLLDLKEKSLKLKEEEHEANMAIKNVELQIKTIELELLKTQK